MREILFRGLQMFHENNDWVYGYLKIGDIAGKITAFIIPADFDKCKIKEAPVYESTVGQYIGMEDRNGVKIFDGDIIQDGNCEYNKYVVKYDVDRGGYVPFAHGDGCGCCETHTLYDSTCHEVIGNIYDNPELMEESK